MAGGIHFRVWAPKRRTVEVVINDGTGIVALESEPGGYFSGLAAGAAAGSRYRFQLDGGDRFPDPASRFQPEGPHGPSEVIDPTFAWTDQGWPGLVLPGQVIQEIHFGTFTPEGTYAAAAEKLPFLKEVGITTVEVMPVAAFPGRFGWGYDGVDLFAPVALYGRPDDFRRFVDRAHALGLGVLLDVVYNHFGPSGNYLRQYSDHYFNTRDATEWGEPINFDGPDSGPVRDFFLANASYWIDEFHIDGLRLDATHAIFDRSEEHILKAIGRAARGAGVWVGGGVGDPAASPGTLTPTLSPAGEREPDAGGSFSTEDPAAGTLPHPTPSRSGDRSYGRPSSVVSRRSGDRSYREETLERDNPLNPLPKSADSPSPGDQPVAPTQHSSTSASQHSPQPSTFNLQPSTEFQPSAFSLQPAPGVLVFAESDSQEAWIARPVEQGGYGLDGVWNDDFHHSARVALTGQRRGYYASFSGTPQELVSAAKYGYLYQGQWYGPGRRGSPALALPPAAFVTFIENHDQIANSAAGLRLHQLTSPGRWRAMTALFLLLPATPLLFQGQEFAASAPFLYFADHEPDLAKAVRTGRGEFLRQFVTDPAVLDDPGDPATFERCRIDWSERGRHQAAIALHRDLLTLRREDPVFRLQRRVDGAVLAEQVFVLRFFGDGDDRLLLVNLGRDLDLGPVAEPLLAPPAGRWETLWTSDDPRYGGAGVPPIEVEGWRIPGEASVVLGKSEE